MELYAQNSLVALARRPQTDFVNKFLYYNKVRPIYEKSAFLKCPSLILMFIHVSLRSSG